MKNIKWPIVLLIPLILAALAFGDGTFWDRDSDQASSLNQNQNRAQNDASVGAPNATLTWFCPIIEPGAGLELLNAAPVDTTVRVTIYASLFEGTAPNSDLNSNPDFSRPYLAAAFTANVPAAGTQTLNLEDFFLDAVREEFPEDVSRASDLLAESAVFLSALVEFPASADGSDLSGNSLGRAADPSRCIAEASTEWYIPFASTARDACYFIAVFNPFSAPAVVDVEFATDSGVRTPYEGSVIPAGSTVVFNVTSKVTRRDHISTSLKTRTGRVVASKYLTFTGKPEEIPRSCPEAPYDFFIGAAPKLWGSQVLVGAPSAHTDWYFPAGTNPLSAASYVVYNPNSEEEAIVEVNLRPNVGSTLEQTLIVSPSQRAVVQMSEGNLHPLPVFPPPLLVPPFESLGIGHWAHFESETPIVVERVQTGVYIPNGILGGLGLTEPKTQTPIYKSSLNFGLESGVAIESDIAIYVIVNPLEDTIAQITINGIISGVEIGPGRRYLLGIPSASLRGSELLISTTPVVAEPRL